jgi:glycine betaine/proline transport system substrate-binding protein
LLKKYWKIHNFITLFALLLIAGCGSEEDVSNSSTDGENSGDNVNYSEAVNYTIYGIEPGAGLTHNTEEAIEQYDSLNGWNLEASSTAAMTVELERALENEEPIIVTAWSPHWLFAKYDIKYLDDPEKTFGEPGEIRTLARLGLEEDKPNAYKFLDQFYWEVEDMESIILEAEETGDDIKDVAKRWVEENPDRVAEWTEGVEDVDGVSITLAMNTYESELASGYVIVESMKQKGFEVELIELDIAVFWEAVASGEADATHAAWLPTNMKSFYDAHEGNFVDLGPSMEGTTIGLAVPSYMDVDSIEDLEPAE